jgi:hypothetical protein
MPTPTVRKSSRPPKRRPSSPIEQNAKRTPKATSKRVKSAKFINPNAVDKNDVADTSDTSDDVETNMDSIVDVSNNVYTVSRSCMLGTEPVYEDTDFLKLGDFSYRQFDTLSIRKLEKLALASKFDFEWLSGQAVVSAKGVPMREYLKFPIEDETCWEKVERGVKMWMEQLKKDIKVKLTVIYKKKSVITAISSDDEDGTVKKVFKFKVRLILGSQRTYYKTA